MRWIFPMVIFLAAGCGQTSSNKAGNKGPSQDATASVCKRGFCEEMPISIDSPSLDGVVLTGWHGQDVAWSFEASLQTSSAEGAVAAGRSAPVSQRKLAIRFSDLPAGAKAGAFAVPATVSWVPSMRGRGDVPVKVHVRDLSRCEAFASDPRVCSDPSSPEGQSYEQVQSFPWTIGDSATMTGAASPEVIKVSDPNCGSKNGSSNNGVLAQGLATGIQVLQGMNDPAELLMKVLPSALSSATGGGDSDVPNPC